MLPDGTQLCPTCRAVSSLVLTKAEAALAKADLLVDRAGGGGIIPEPTENAKV
jgi:hypothetical protein